MNLMNLTNSPLTNYIINCISLAIQTIFIFYIVLRYFGLSFWPENIVIYSFIFFFILIEFIVITRSYYKSKDNPQKEATTKMINPLDFAFSPFRGREFFESLVTDEPSARKEILETFYEIDKFKKRTVIDDTTMDIEATDQMGAPHIYRLKYEIQDKTLRITSFNKYK
ncbi:hypothetical protein CVV38_00320 [Candidatus Peregrinibacteria bacterium HGW-Peregrinibacteria-1]|jgi:hypothetical protein|nr:MAG: hypothetical protein CVV38_00320 [Candidatus Peregrinibacteria bacterium HGW-Peregrinibacteria-1]